MIEYGSPGDWQRLVGIMSVLRSEDGCPWDRTQTHQSIRTNLIEECYEAVDAIDRCDTGLLCEELGDVLLQVVFHSQIAYEEGCFTIDDVVRGLCEKLIRRHEHVFGQNKAENAAVAVERWDAAKKREKSAQTAGQSLEAIPRNLPALMRAVKLASRASKIPCPDELFPSGQKQAQPWDEHSAGQALFVLAAEMSEAGIDPEQALDRFNQEFILSISRWEEH
ncbi:MAG: MazG family protein [Oscillospiraceae bacterium]|nr:MazG family protein [Oscillospiraceae bacterium]